MNLLVNGDAGKGPGGTAEPVGRVDGWVVRQGAPALVGYDVGGGYPTPGSPGPGEAGARFFSGGNSAVTTLVQEVPVPTTGPTGHGAVDAGRVRYVLSGWLGGYAAQEDGVRLSVEFRDRAGTPLALSVLGPVTAAERAHATALLERSAEAAVPPGARSARVQLSFTRTGTGGGTSNDGYADAISLRLTTTGRRK
ncbi:phosphoesterase [Streptomyces sp. NBC_01511]|uniref:phosphoesterase n=1 Tax=Streptomyces sp. NBC_01511 TaxID=2903889 RepID=UPI00386E3AA9